MKQDEAGTPRETLSEFVRRMEENPWFKTAHEELEREIERSNLSYEEKELLKRSNRDEIRDALARDQKDPSRSWLVVLF